MQYGSTYSASCHRAGQSVLVKRGAGSWLGAAERSGENRAGHRFD